MKKAFPAIRPFRTQTIAVSPPHVLYVEESGNPDGIPVLFCMEAQVEALEAKIDAFLIQINTELFCLINVALVNQPRMLY